MSDHPNQVDLEAYIEHLLPAQQRLAVEQHLYACPSCQARLARARKLEHALHRLTRRRPAPDLASRINWAIYARQSQARDPGWMAWLLPATLTTGILLLTLSAAEWTGWLQSAITTQPMTEQLWMWLGGIFEPGALLDNLGGLAQAMAGESGLPISQWLTLAIIALAFASLMGLVQLLKNAPLSEVEARD